MGGWGETNVGISVRTRGWLGHRLAQSRYTQGAGDGGDNSRTADYTFRYMTQNWTLGEKAGQRQQVIRTSYGPSLLLRRALRKNQL